MSDGETLPVNTPEFWHKRLLEAHASGRGLPTAIYDTDPDNWQYIQNQTAGYLQRYLLPGTRVVDVGCGYGAIYDLLPNKIKYVGLDISPDLIEIARIRYPKGDFRVFDVMTLNESDKKLVDKFDYCIARSIEAMVISNLGFDVWQVMLEKMLMLAPIVMLIEYHGDCKPTFVRRKLEKL